MGIAANVCPCDKQSELKERSLNDNWEGYVTCDCGRRFLSGSPRPEPEPEVAVVKFEMVDTAHILRKEVTDRIAEILESGGIIISVEKTYEYSKATNSGNLAMKRYEIFWRKSKN